MYDSEVFKTGGISRLLAYAQSLKSSLLSLLSTDQSMLPTNHYPHLLEWQVRPSFIQPNCMSQLQDFYTVLLQLGESATSGVALFKTSLRVAKRG